VRFKINIPLIYFIQYYHTFWVPSDRIEVFIAYYFTERDSRSPRQFGADWEKLSWQRVYPKRSH